MDPQNTLNIQIFERLARHDEKQDTIIQKLDSYHKEVVGNGRPGLKQQVEELTAWQIQVQSGWNTVCRILTWSGALIGTCGTLFALMTAWIKRHG